MKKLFFILSFLSVATTLLAQSTGSIKGKIIDSVGKQILKDASVSILDAKDSSVELLGLAKQDGTFEVRNIPYGTYIVHISFQSYAPVYKNIIISKTKPDLSLGTIYLVTSADRLPDVVVTQSALQIKGDTTVFNASSFKTKPNAVAEDLLKKLPGVEVGTDGSIKAQGETVSRVLVNGKRFFGDDPKMATKNLPPDVIDKIQVFDDLSDQSKFTGFDDGNKVKTINITTKKNTNKGYFGKVVAGAGSADNYDANFNIHRFDDNLQISALGQGNNVNKQNFSQADILGGGPRGGRGGGSGGTGSGITTTWAGGLNFKDSWGKLNSSAYGSYFFNQIRNDVNSESQTQTIVTSDSSNYKNSTSTSTSTSPSHSITFNLEENFDTLNSLVFRPNFSLQSSNRSSNSSNITTGGTSGTLINSAIGNTSSNTSGFNIGGTNLQLRHKFAKKYRTISADINFSASSNAGDGYNYSVNTFYKTIHQKDTVIILNQYHLDTFHSYSFNPTISYTEPISKNSIIEFRYSYSYSRNNSTSNTYEFDSVTHAYDKFSYLYSNSYRYVATSNTGTISYRLQQAKYNFNVGTGIQVMDYKSENLVKGVTVANNVVNFTPTANFMYNYSKTKSLRFFYSGRTGQPSVANLQPIKSVSGLDTTIGNANLSPQFTHSLRLMYSSFDMATQNVMFATVNASMTTNDIQNSVIQYNNGTKTTTYANLNGTFNVNGYFNYAFSLKKPKSNLNFTTNIGYSQAQSLLADSSSAFMPRGGFTRNTNLGESIKWTTNLADHFDMNLSAGINYVIATSTFYPQRNANYANYNAGFDLTYYTTSGWIFASDFSYSYSGNRAPGYAASVPLVSPSIAKQLFKNKRGELRLYMFDLLNQNQSVSRTVSGNTIVDSRSNVLTRYFMLTFTYNLRNFAGQQQKMQGMFRGMRPPDGMGGFPRDGGGGGFGGGGFRRN